MKWVSRQFDTAFGSSDSLRTIGRNDFPSMPGARSMFANDSIEGVRSTFEARNSNFDPAAMPGPFSSRWMRVSKSYTCSVKQFIDCIAW